MGGTSSTPRHSPGLLAVGIVQQKGTIIMKAPSDFVRIIDRKRYSVKTATLIADNAYWDGHNFERSGRNTFLYRTPGGAYFEVNLTQWQGERDTLISLSRDEAIELYEKLDDVDAVSFELAFPGIEVKDA
jgi:hypothetical protein